MATKAQHRYKALLLTACLATSAWAFASAAALIGLPSGGYGRFTPVVLEQTRSIAWMGVATYVLFVAYKRVVDPVLALIFLCVVASCMAYAVAQAAFGITGILGFTGEQVRAFASIFIAIGGLVLAENLFRNAGPEMRWAVKYLCFGVGVLFAYDLVLYARFALFGRMGEDLYAARGIIDAMAAPMVVMAAARSKRWPIDLHVSRRIVFHTATILVAGVYLIGMSIVGYYLRLLDSFWGQVARVAFFAAAILVLAILLSSSSVHARIKDFINRNFFSYRYDYRQEWLNFIAAVSSDASSASIPERIVRALANLLNCTSGAAWIYVEEDRAYRQAAAWNISGLEPNVLAQDALPMLLASKQGIVDLKKSKLNLSDALPEALPRWLTEHPRTWLVVPLAHERILVGFVVIGRPRTARELNWEDFELLATAGRQAASYVAEELAAASLAKARRFEDFNRQFAFVVHDIKNLAGQMSLILKNAERHGSNPEFQKDVMATVADSLQRMQALLDQLKRRRSATAVETVDLTELLERLVGKWRLQIPGLRADLLQRTVQIVADPSNLEAIFNHLVQNAADASGAGGKVEITMRLDRPQEVAVSVSDEGPGMDQAFIAKKLFEPMDSTKESGYGLGAYQVLCLVRDIGGTIDVKSEIGQGTSMVVKLPLSMPLVGPLQSASPESIARKAS